MTDRFINFLWFDIGGNFPTATQLPLLLFVADFDAVNNFAGSTTVNFSGSPPIGFQFQSTPATINFAPTLAIAASNADRNEGNSGQTAFTFTVTRGGNTAVATSVDYAVSGSGANPAVAADFASATFPTGQVQFAANETSKTVTINVAGDVSLESDEAFVVTLNNATGGATITTTTANGTIRNDDFLDLVYTGTGSTVVTASVLTSGPLQGHLQVKLGMFTQADAAPAFVRSLTINGGTGADVINLTGLSRGAYLALTSIRLNGNAGVDRITGSNDFSEIISGGLGNDILNGGVGGTDRLVESALLPTSTSALSLTLTNTTLTGGFGSDALSNFEEAVLTGAGGGDTFNAAGFSGRVTLIGNGGLDKLTGGNNNDSLDGGVGNDVLVGGAGDDVLSGGAGTDKLTGGAGSDQLLGGTESDTVLGSGATTYELTDSSLTGDGADFLNGIEAASLTLLATGSAAGRIDASRFTGSGKNTLTGGAGPDTILGGSGPDSIVAGAGNDLLTGGLGNDSFNGGSGTDRLRETGNVNFVLTNSALTGLGTDVITSSTIELVELTGGIGDNRLNALAFTFGSVTLDGGDGHDVLLGGGRADSLIGGAGRDLLVGGASIDNLTGGGGDDILIGGTIASTIKTTTALNAIMLEWTSASSLTDRKNHMLSGGGLNGSNKLKTTTVLNDSSAADRLTGSEDLDWFFQSASDVLVDFNVGLGDTKTP